MQRDEALRQLREHEAELRSLGVESLFVFGSTARDEARADSDVDLFFDDERGALGLFDLMEVRDRAARILGGKAAPSLLCGRWAQRDCRCYPNSNVVTP